MKKTRRSNGLVLETRPGRRPVEDERGLLVCGGFDPDCLAEWEGDDFCQPAEVPPGDYRVDIYTYSTSGNAMLIDEAAWEAQVEALEEAADEAEERETPYVDFLFQFRPWDEATCSVPMAGG